MSSNESSQSNQGGVARRVGAYNEEAAEGASPATAIVVPEDENEASSSAGAGASDDDDDDDVVVTQVVQIVHEIGSEDDEEESAVDDGEEGEDGNGGNPRAGNELGGVDRRGINDLLQQLFDEDPDAFADRFRGWVWAGVVGGGVHGLLDVLGEEMTRVLRHSIDGWLEENGR